MSCVICIGASNGKGKLVDFSSDEPDNQNYAAIGIAVTGASISKYNDSNFVRYLSGPNNDSECKSGTSVATSIAAGIAALFLEYTGIPRDHFEPKKRHIHLCKLFFSMSKYYGGTYRVLLPWMLLDRDVELSRKRIADALANGNSVLLSRTDHVCLESHEVIAPKTSLKVINGTSFRTLSDLD